MSAALINPAVGAAMSAQVDRVNGSPTLEAINDLLRQENRRLETLLLKRDEQIAYWQSIANGQRVTPVATPATITGHFQDGIEYVSQKEAALILHVRAYQISRWVAAGKFELLSVPHRRRKQIVRSSLYMPAPSQPGRKKGH